MKDKISDDLRYEMQAIQYRIEQGNAMGVNELKYLWNDLSEIVTRVDALYTTEISEGDIKKESAIYEAKCRCELPDIKKDDWYFDYVNEDFIAGATWALSKHRNKTPLKLADSMSDICANYESDDTTGMNCKWCGYPKRAH